MQRCAKDPLHYWFFHPHSLRASGHLFHCALYSYFFTYVYCLLCWQIEPEIEVLRDGGEDEAVSSNSYLLIFISGCQM